MSEDDLDLETGAIDPAAGDGQSAGQDQDEPKVVPLAVHIALRKDLSTKIDDLKDQISLYRAQQHLASQERGAAGHPPVKASDPYFEGRDDDDVVTVAEMKQVLRSERSSINAGLSEAQFARHNPDYKEVIEKHLPNVIRTNPELYETLLATHPTKRHVVAYLMGKEDPEFKTKKVREKLEKPHEDAAAIAANKGKPGTGGKPGGSPLSQADRYASMSDEDLEKQIEQAKFGAAR